MGTFLIPTCTRLAAALLLAAGLAGCALAPQAAPDTEPSPSSSEAADATGDASPAPPALSPAAAAALAQSPWARQSASAGAPAAWKHHAFPGKKSNAFQPVRLDGRDAIAVHADASARMLRTVVRIEPEDLGTLRFSWKVAALLEQADVASRDRDDAPVRLVLAFEGDRRRFGPRDAMLNELVRAVTGEEMPYATLMYVWCNTRPPGEVVAAARTSRIRKVVVESGAGGLNRWREYERDVRADYERAFGEPPGALVGIGIMTDTDNTRTEAKAWYGPVQLAPSLHR